MTTPELLALIDRTVIEYETANPNRHITVCPKCGARFDRRYGHDCKSDGPAK